MTSQHSKEGGLYLTGMGHFVPENILDNEFFDSLDIGSDAQWIVDRVGIVERRSVLTPAEIRAMRFGEVTREELFNAGRIMSFGQMGARSWQTTLARRRGSFDSTTSQIDAVIGGTSVPDSDIPSHACYAARDASIKTGFAFDTNSACSTFAVQLHTMRGLFAIGSARNGAIFGAERYTTRVDYSDRKGCILFGDSAYSAFLESSPRGKCLQVIDSVIESSPEGADTIRMLDGKPFEQDGRAVQKFAILKTVSAAQTIMARNQLDVSNVRWFVGHQANLRMLVSAAERIGIEPDRHIFNVDFHGNQGGAGAPVTISQNWDRFRDGDNIVMSVVGSGLTWGSVLFRVLEV
jgi:3-oxoacyl-[acyl-carrier-protein] synthase III